MSPSLAKSPKSHRSTGPRTAAGKSTSSRNALRHGLASGQLLITGEDIAEWQSLLNGLIAEWKPATATEQLLVENMAKHHWLVERALRLQSEALATAKPGDLPANFTVLLRYQTTNERAFTRALRSLEAMRKTQQQFVSQNNKQAAAEAEAAVWASFSAPLPKLDYAGYLERKAAANPPQPIARPAGPKTSAATAP